MKLTGMCYQCVINFKGLNFCGLGSQGDFVGLYFRGKAGSQTVHIIIRHFVDKKTHKFRENLNSMKIRTP